MYEAIRKIPNVESIRSYARFRQTLIIGSLFLMNNDYQLKPEPEITQTYVNICQGQRC